MNKIRKKSNIIELKSEKKQIGQQIYYIKPQL